jgi:hypothetical protein
VLPGAGKSMSDLQGGNTADILQQTLQKVLLKICVNVDDNDGSFA